MGEQRRFAFCDAIQPLPCPLLMSSEALVFPADPPDQIAVDVLQGGEQRRVAELAVVGDPAPDHRVEHSGQVGQCFVAAPVKPPVPHRLADRREGFAAGRRREGDKAAPVPVLRQPGPDRVAQEVEGLARVGRSLSLQ
jgi:hypothetical protein